MNDLSDWLSSHHRAVFVTVGADGRPQTSNIVYSYQDGVARVSVTDTRAKTRNLRRNNNAVLHVLGDDFGSFVSASVTSDVGRISVSPRDPVGRDLADIYSHITGHPHPNWDEFYDAMVDERRLVLSLHIERVTGQHPLLLRGATFLTWGGAVQ